jgi:NAD+ synthetase
MPSRYSSEGSVQDARALAENLGIEYHTIAIEPIYRTFLDQLEPLFKKMPFGIAEENIQARARGSLLMAVSNKFGWLVLSTGNKSEMAVGYCTLYGDMNGGLAVLADVLKTRVYALARWINRDEQRIPREIIAKVPSAELRENQSDQDSLPPYEELDPIIAAYVEEDAGPEQIVAAGHDPETVSRVIGMIDRAEYKRRQAALSLKVTTKAFGSGRRMPIARGK